MSQLTPESPLPPSCKLSRVDSSGNPTPFDYGGAWALEQTSGPARLVIAPRHGQHVQVLLALARCLPGPCRYQGPSPTSLEETEAFVRTFAPFFEGDGRHHLWLMSLPAGATLVYDNHDLIYAYGPLDEFQLTLEKCGLRSGTVSIPSPHEHWYHSEFDEAERDLMNWWDWRSFPLQPDDDS